MGGTAFVPTLSLDAGLTNYLAEIRKFPMLRPDQESAYAKRWREHGDREAAYHLVTSHLRLVAKIAMRYRGYGLPIADIISEGNVGLMQAVKRFEPERGFRLATYAMWWIKASIQEYILRSWSLVMGRIYKNWKVVESVPHEARLMGSNMFSRCRSATRAAPPIWPMSKRTIPGRY